jgi:hypothetical protein
MRFQVEQARFGRNADRLAPPLSECCSYLSSGQICERWYANWHQSPCTTVTSASPSPDENALDRDTVIRDRSVTVSASPSES